MNEWMDGWMNEWMNVVWGGVGFLCVTNKGGPVSQLI
jgi:hypothetical protein